jgi:hypothetical protein
MMRAGAMMALALMLVGCSSSGGSQQTPSLGTVGTTTATMTSASHRSLQAQQAETARQIQAARLQQAQALAPTLQMLVNDPYQGGMWKRILARQKQGATAKPAARVRVPVNGNPTTTVTGPAGTVSSNGDTTTITSPFGNATIREKTR